MSKRTEIMGFQQAIALPGVRVGRTGMAFERVDEETLHAAGAFLQAVDAACAWWWGDFLAAYCGFRLKVDEEDNGSAFDELTRQAKVRNYGSDYSVICNREPKTLWHWKSVADFYESSRRREDLTWSHHIEAKEASNGDKAVADNWLDLAVKHRWSHSQLRAAIRKTKREQQGDDEGPAAQTLLPMELVACRRFASAHLAGVADMDVEEARAQLAELEQVHAYIVALTRRVGAGLAAVGMGESVNANASAVA